MATGVGRVACCQPVAVSLVKSDAGQEVPLLVHKCAHMRAGVGGALIKAQSSDVAIAIGLEFHAYFHRLGVRVRVPRRVVVLFHRLHGHWGGVPDGFVTVIVFVAVSEPLCIRDSEGDGISASGGIGMSGMLQGAR